MAGYVSKFATGATIEEILDKANNSQSVSAAEKTSWNNKQNALTTAQLAAVNSGVTAEMISNWINGYIYQTGGDTSSKTITLDPTSAYIVFITYGSWVNFYFLNSTTIRAYIKEITDQMSADIVATYDGLSVTFTSTAGNAFTLFARKLN